MAPDATFADRSLIPKRVESVVDRSYQARKVADSIRLHDATLTALGTDVAGLREIVEARLGAAGGEEAGPLTQGLTEEQFASLSTLYTQVQTLEATVADLVLWRSNVELVLDDHETRLDDLGAWRVNIELVIDDHEARLDAGGL